MSRKPPIILGAAAATLAAALLLYSQLRAFAWDEGFHLLAAQLILQGKRPYLDFFFPQTPLNAYWNALWFACFGDTWRTAHAVAALCTAAASLIVADYMWKRFPVPGWRLPGALSVLAIMGLNTAVFEYGTIGQAYGLCLLLLSAAFRCCILAAERPGAAYSAATGLLASAAAASSLLAAPALPVMLLWIVLYRQAGSRLRKATAFGVFAAIPFLPVLLLALRKPREVLFAVLQYNYRFREVGWDGTATAHNIEVFTAWLDSPQAFLTGLLAVAGWWFVSQSSGWPRGRRAEFLLCAWLSIALGLYLCTAHPTFQRYFLLTMPFLATLAAAGLYWAGSRLAGRPARAATLACLLAALCLAKDIFAKRDAFFWKDVEAVARKVNRVTPRGAAIWADEHVYFVSRRVPPEGMEHENSHKPLGLTPEFTRALHILPRAELEARIHAGTYYTSVTCEDSERIDALNLAAVYERSEEIGDCEVYWLPKKH